MPDPLPEADVLDPDHAPELVDVYETWLYGEGREREQAKQLREDYRDQFVAAYDKGTAERKYHTTVEMSAFNTAMDVHRARTYLRDDLNWLQHRWEDDHQDWHETGSRIDGMIAKHGPVVARRLPYFIGGAAAGQGATDNPFLALAAGIGTAVARHAWDAYAEDQVADEREGFEERRDRRRDTFQERKQDLYDDVVGDASAAYARFIADTEADASSA